MNPRICAFALSFALVALPAGSLASSFYEQPFPDTVREASSIVRGKVGKSETQWVNFPDGGKRLFTFYEVEVSEGFKGPAKAGTLRMRELGGEKDGVTLQISGSAQFTPGEDIVVMLGEPVEGENTFPLSGMMMGKYTLEKNAEGKEVLRGSGIGSSVHPKLRNGDAEGAKDREYTLENLREIVRKQATEPAKPKNEISPISSPSADSQLGSKKISEVLEPEVLERETPLRSRTDSLPIRPIYGLIGLAAGVYWFLKTKKNRR